MNDDLVFYVPFNIIEDIPRQWKDDNERICVMCAVHSWDKFDLQWDSNPGPPPHLATRRLLQRMEYYTKKAWLTVVCDSHSLSYKLCVCVFVWVRVCVCLCVCVCKRACVRMCCFNVAECDILFTCTLSWRWCFKCGVTDLRRNAHYIN